MINFRSEGCFIFAKKSRGNIYELTHSKNAQLKELKRGNTEIVDEKITKKIIHAKGLNSDGNLGTLKRPFSFICINNGRMINHVSQTKLNRI